MSEEQTNINNLEELLARFKNEQTNTDLDPFEQEALEGFEQMESKEAVRDFVNSTQERLHKRLRIQHQEKRKPKTYWLMAASIVLFAGLSVVFYSVLQESEQTRHVVIQEPKIEAQKKIESMPPKALSEATETITSINQNAGSVFSKEKAKEKMDLRVNDKKSAISKEEERQAEKDNTYKTIASTASPVAIASDEAFALDESKVKKDTTVVLSKNAINGAPAKDIAPSNWSDGIAATETKKREREEVSKPSSTGYSIKRSETNKSKSNEELDKVGVNTAPASTFVETKPYYTEGNAALTAKLKAQFLKNEALKTMAQKLEIEISLNEANEIKAITIPNLKEDRLKVEVIKELKQLTGYRTAQKDGKNIPSVFVFTFQP